MENIILHVYYTCKPGKAQAFVRELKDRGLQAKVQAEDGCIQYDYHISCELPDTVVLLEKWRDAAALESHGTQPHMAEVAALKPEFVEETRVEKYL